MPRISYFSKIILNYMNFSYKLSFKNIDVIKLSERNGVNNGGGVRTKLMLRRSICCRFMITKGFYYVQFPPLRICEGRKEESEGEMKMSISEPFLLKFQNCRKGRLPPTPLQILIGNIAVTCSVISLRSITHKCFIKIQLAYLKV